MRSVIAVLFVLFLSSLARPALAADPAPAPGLAYEIQWLYGNDTSNFEAKLAEGYAPTMLSASYDSQGKAGVWVVWAKATPAVKGKFEIGWLYGTNTSDFDARVKAGKKPVFLSAGTDSQRQAGVWVIWQKP